MNALRTPITAPRRILLTSLLVVPCFVAAVVAGCGDDDDNPATTTLLDSGVDGHVVTKADTGTNAPDTGANPQDSGNPSDAGTDADAGGLSLADKIARGTYLVTAVAACGDCHTPRDQNGPILAKALSGVECFIDVNGAGTDGGCLNSANLTNDATGLANRTDTEIKNMILNGVRPDGKFLQPVMPYYTFHNFTSDDADAIVAYLRTVTAVAHTTPANDAPFTAPSAAAAPLDPTTIPVASDAGIDGGGDVVHGRYLAQFACLECHTPDNSPGSLNMALAFGGNKDFVSAQIGVPSPPFPATIYSANITPSDTGLKGYSVDDIEKAFKAGTDKDGGGICPPMPAGPMQTLGNLSAQDALDIAAYIHNLPPVNNAVTGGNGSCVVPTQP